MQVIGQDHYRIHLERPDGTTVRIAERNTATASIEASSGRRRFDSTVKKTIHRE